MQQRGRTGWVHVPPPPAPPSIFFKVAGQDPTDGRGPNHLVDLGAAGRGRAVPPGRGDWDAGCRGPLATGGGLCTLSRGPRPRWGPAPELAATPLVGWRTTTPPAGGGGAPATEPLAGGPWSRSRPRCPIGPGMGRGGPVPPLHRCASGAPVTPTGLSPLYATAVKHLGHLGQPSVTACLEHIGHTPLKRSTAHLGHLSHTPLKRPTAHLGHLGHTPLKRSTAHLGHLGHTSRSGHDTPRTPRPHPFEAVMTHLGHLGHTSATHTLDTSATPRTPPPHLGHLRRTSGKSLRSHP